MSLEPSVLFQAVAEIRRDASKVRGQLALAESLEKIGSIENAANEAQTRLDRLKAEEAAHTNEIVKAAQKEAEMSRQAIEQAHTQAVAAANNIREAAVAHAHEIVQTAEGVATHHQSLASTARERLTEIEAKIEAALAHHADLTKKITAANSDHERIKAAKAAALATLAM